MLKNLMEEIQLDFNAPLLSVRRFSSTTTSEGKDNKSIEISLGHKSSLPFYKSELKSGPVRNPGEVPFMWEQIPGRPKDGAGSEIKPLKRPPIAPKLPPGRILEFKQQSAADKEFKDINAIRSRNDNILSTGHTISYLNDNVTKLKSSQGTAKGKKDYDSEDGDDTFTDARDTLSRTESFFFNCSVSGVSGLDDMNAKPSGIFSTDPQTWDFMMGRFLPAAKAMSSETPHYAPRKPPVRHEEAPQLKKVVNDDMRLALYQSRPNVVPQYTHDTEEDESEDEEEEDDYDDTEMSTKACGLLPRFCFKNSLCLLNPVPAMKVRIPSHATSVRKIKTQIKVTNSKSHCDKNVGENNWEAVYKHKQMNALQPLEDESKLTSESNRITCSSDSQTPDGSSSYRHSSGGGISPYRNEVTPSPFHEGMGFLGVPEPVKSNKAISLDSHKRPHNNFHDILSHHNWKQGSGSPSPIEKTLYIDSVNGVETLNASDIRGIVEFGDEDSEILVVNRGMEESCIRDINNFTLSKVRGTSGPANSNTAGANLQSSGRSNLGGNIHRGKEYRKSNNLDQEYRYSLISRVPTSVNSNFSEEKSLKEDGQGKSILLALLPPPLPKSPSESWLWHTLPSVSSRNGRQLHPSKHSSNTSSTNPKWETIVKTSNMKHGLLRISEVASHVLGISFMLWSYKGGLHALKGSVNSVGLSLLKVKGHKLCWPVQMQSIEDKRKAPGESAKCKNELAYLEKLLDIWSVVVKCEI
ncbi:hypothetical protein GIB67_039971 [Kingdonia uniflora]|uniref:Uncharacterized protein n=1 Tax=Kingdonia uniflora TaxID=39325 RepID=A0A7J7P3W1_9MAGN|nr:hypothetical protein GIB67_039971 [Kingdonia uniflora]